MYAILMLKYDIPMQDAIRSACYGFLYVVIDLLELIVHIHILRK